MDVANTAWELLVLSTNSEEQQIRFILNNIVKERMALLLSQFEQTRQPRVTVPVSWK